ncbi:glycosyltransferase [bacterium]|nr:glycosyltransferase [bacterium]
MLQKSIFYKHPLLYQQALKIIHGKKLNERYRLIASFIKKEEKILEPGCGTALLVNFLAEQSSYSGFDLNKKFIEYAQKKYKKANFYIGDILDKTSYSPTDVVVVCDVLHHISPDKRKVFINYCFKAAKKKLIICEPKGENTLSLGKRFFNYFEQDGINQIHSTFLWNEEEFLKEINNGFGIIPNQTQRKIEKIGKDIVCVFFKTEVALKTKKISAIIPVFNEEKTVKKIVEAFLKSELIDEVICVNDGSTDRSREILESFGKRIKLINLRKNKGKGYALAKGVESAKGEIVVFWDADFPDLSVKHIETLIRPALREDFKAIFGVPIKNKLNLSLPTRVFLTGERVYHRDFLLPHLEKMKKTRFGVEVFLNRLVDKKDIKIFPLEGLTFPYKYEKRNISQASKEYLAEAIEIAKELSKSIKLLPEDIKIINDLKENLTFQELKLKIQKIKNKEIKTILKNYILKYIKFIKNFQKEN